MRILPPENERVWGRGPSFWDRHKRQIMPLAAAGAIVGGVAGYRRYGSRLVDSLLRGTENFLRRESGRLTTGIGMNFPELRGRRGALGWLASSLNIFPELNARTLLRAREAWSLTHESIEEHIVTGMGGFRLAQAVAQARGTPFEELYNVPAANFFRGLFREPWRNSLREFSGGIQQADPKLLRLLDIDPTLPETELSSRIGSLHQQISTISGEVQQQLRGATGSA